MINYFLMKHEGRTPTDKNISETVHTDYEFTMLRESDWHQMCEGQKRGRLCGDRQRPRSRRIHTYPSEIVQKQHLQVPASLSVRYLPSSGHRSSLQPPPPTGPEHHRASATGAPCAKIKRLLCLSPGSIPFKRQPLAWLASPGAFSLPAAAPPTSTCRSREGHRERSHRPQPPPSPPPRTS